MAPTTRVLEVTDFIEIDFIEVGDRGSGDAIAIRHHCNGGDYVHVVDGGYAADGQKLVDHIREHYGPGYFINHLVLTHSDLDHASGLETVLREMRVESLWMNRPWRHVDLLMDLFARYQNRDRLIARLKSAFPKVAELEALAIDKGVQIRDAFQGHTIGPFTILSPSAYTYLFLVAESEKTPVLAPWLDELLAVPADTVSGAQWGAENLKGDSEGTSPDNETSIVQFADVCGKKVLLTGDAGVQALTEAHQAALQMGLPISPLDWFQVPHHGSRRNLSSNVLDTWLGPRRPPQFPSSTFDAVISANQNDQEHPKKAVVRALIHRGRRVFQTQTKLHVHSSSAPQRGWGAAQQLDYPQDQED